MGTPGQWRPHQTGFLRLMSAAKRALAHDLVECDACDAYSVIVRMARETLEIGTDVTSVTPALLIASTIRLAGLLSQV